MLALLLTALLVSENPVKAPNDFWAHWGDGRGEISSFKLTILATANCVKATLC